MKNILHVYITFTTALNDLEQYAKDNNLEEHLRYADMSVIDGDTRHMFLSIPSREEYYQICAIDFDDIIYENVSAFVLSPSGVKKLIDSRKRKITNEKNALSNRRRTQACGLDF